MKKAASLLYSVYNKIRRDVVLARFRKRSGNDNAKAIFGHYFKHNLFGDAESLSGTGSSLGATENIRAALPGLLKDVDARSVLDIPCGDFYWAKEIDWSDIEYTGADIVADLVEQNRVHYAGDGLSFMEIDIIKDELPYADLILCRDLFIHLPNQYVQDALANIKRSGAKYLLTTTYRKISRNKNIVLGSFRPLNLEKEPFCLPEPLKVVPDYDYLALWQRTLCLWRVSDLP